MSAVELKDLLQSYKRTKLLEGDSSLEQHPSDVVGKKRRAQSDYLTVVSADHTASTSSSSHRRTDVVQFLIIGAQKAGTMAAVKNLNKHPQIFCVNEAHYFDLAWNSKDTNWYVSQFKASSKPIKGEKTPELIYVDDCPGRIKEVCPHAKFLLFIREPIARAFSSWNMNCSKNREMASFDECIERNMGQLDEHRSYGTAEFHYLQRGFYIDQIRRFQQVFPDLSSLLVVVAERIRSRPSEEYSRIFRFLGADPSFSFTAEDEHMGSYSSSIGARVLQRLRTVYRPYNEQLYDFLGYRIDEWESQYEQLTAAPGVGERLSSEGTPAVSLLKPPLQLPAANDRAQQADSCSTSEEAVGLVVPTAILTTVDEEASGSAVSDSVHTRSHADDSGIVKTTKNHPPHPRATGLSTVGGSSSSEQLSTAIVLSEVRSDGLFASLGTKHGTDKVTHHGYQRFYPRFIEHFRQLSGAAMLEIGVDRSHSLHMWLEYYPAAFIYGIDINISSSGERYRIFKADQSQPRALQRIVESELKHPLFLILDDGSHIPEHQVASFDYLFDKALLPGGCYIVEDIETSYWTKNGLYGYTTRYGFHHEKSAMEVFKDLLDDVNREFLHADNRRLQERRVGAEISLRTRQHISSVTFGQNCIIIMKKSAEEVCKYNDRVYRFKSNL